MATYVVAMAPDNDTGADAWRLLTPAQTMNPPICERTLVR